jgi:hypothetical protein
VWRGEELHQSQHWIHPLSSAELQDLDAALTGARRRGLTWEQIGREDFPLPTLGTRLRTIGQALEEGCGIAKLTGLPVERYDDDELRALWFGIGSHLGTAVYQDTQGQLMRAICDEGPDVGARHGEWKTGGQGETFLSSKARAQSSRLLRFHTDRCDVVGLLSVRRARSGGVSRLASAVAVHNEMLGRRPDLVELLFEDYHRSRFGEEAGGDRKSYALPVFGIRDGKFTSHYSRTYIEAAQLMPGIPPMTEAQWEAMDLLHQVAEELCMEMVLEPGDMQFINNHVIYHARSAFEDDPRPGHGRLLYRLWLCTPNHRALPPGHEVLWRNIEPGELRGGIRQATP